MTNLSPAAQAVMDATDYPEDWATRIRVAAALRAVIAITQQYQGNDCLSDEIWTCDADELLAIAAELDNASNPRSDHLFSIRNLEQ